MNYQLITCIVERGRAEHVADAALGAGAQGVTIFSGRGRGVRERLMFLGYLIDPEKEVVLTVAPKSEAGTIFDTIVQAAKLDEPGKGFAYLQDVGRVAGFLTGRNVPPAAAVKLPSGSAKRGRHRAPAARRPKRRRAR